MVSKGPSYVAHRWLIVLAHRWLIMLAHRWLITLVHRWPTINGSQVAHSTLCIGSMLRSLQGSFQVIIGLIYWEVFHVLM